jgi:hypothetical protein
MALIKDNTYKNTIKATQDKTKVQLKVRRNVQPNKRVQHAKNLGMGS